MIAYTSVLMQRGPLICDSSESKGVVSEAFDAKLVHLLVAEHEECVQVQHLSRSGRRIGSGGRGAALTRAQ